MFKDKSKRLKILYLVAALAMFGTGGTVAVMGNNTDNPLFIVFGFAGMVAGVLLIRKWRDQSNVRITANKLDKPANVLAISPTGIEFMHCEEDKLLGLSQKSYNDGKFYHIHHVTTSGTHSHFELPDDDENERYYDPAEMANVVSMPSNKKYFTFSFSLMQTIKLGILGLIVGGEILGLIAME